MTIRAGLAAIRTRAAVGLLLWVLAPAAPLATPRRGDAAVGAPDAVTLNFQDADLEVVLDAVSRAIEFNYVLTPEVRRKVTVQGRIPRRELFNALLAILQVHGLTAIRSGEVYKIVRISTAQAEGVPVVVGLEADPAHRPEELVTHVVPLTYGSAAEVARVLQPMVSREGTIAVHPDTNVLVITDAVDKLRRHLRIARSLDVPTAQAQVQVFPLRFADASALATLLGQLFAGAAPGTAPTPAPPAPTAATAPLPPVEPAPVAAIAGLGEPRAARPVVLADTRTNSLVAAAPPALLERIQALVARLDSETPPTRGVYLYRVEHLRAKDLAATLTALFRRREAGPAERPAGPPPSPVPVPPGASLGTPAEAEREGLAGADVRVIADEPTNTLVVTTTAATWAALEPVLRQLDRMPRRILIEVLVAEVTLGDDTALGVEWALRSGKLRIGGERFTLGTGLDVGPPGIQGPGPFPTPPPGLFPPAPPGLFFILQNEDLLALLQALSRENRLNVLSTPHVLTSENKKAQIHVGSSVPILTSQQQPTTGVVAQPQPAAIITTTVDYRDTGIILTVTPRVSENRFVALEVRQEVSDAVPNVIGGTQSPIFTKRVAETAVVVAEHEALVLGGLIEERRERQREGIPFLSRIPILGYLFGTTRDAARKTELLIVVTPRVVADPAASRSLFEEFKRRAPELRRDLESPPAGLRRPPPTPTAPSGATPGGSPGGFQDAPASSSR